MIQNAGFKAVQMSGYGFAACLLGQPDCGLLTFTEVLNHTSCWTATCKVGASP